ncbi:MAG: hypothetical protein IMZ53_12510 [Thermoplasmata archaeon]|nr:hypothetical protein [Thermoplasmata archaeon]
MEKVDVIKIPDKPRPLVGMTFTFKQYMCSHCQKHFFIQKKEGLSSEEEFKEQMRIYQSPCCKPFHNVHMHRDQEPHGIYIRELKLKIVEIPDEMALVAKRRYASEHGKSDPYKDAKEDDNEEES